MAGILTGLGMLITKLAGGGAEGHKAEAAYMAGYDWKTGKFEFTLKFQYWPETLSFTGGIEWAEKPVFGGTHPLYQWVRTNGRQISFEAIFTTDSALEASVGGGLLSVSPEKNIRNPSLKDVLRCLQYARLPRYEGDLTVSPPPMILLVFPGAPVGFARISKPSKAAENSIPCVMTQCDIEHQAFFPHGELRMFRASFTFNEIVQWETTQFVSRDTISFENGPLVEKG